MSPESRVRSSASRFMYASVSTSPVRQSWATQGTRPRSSNVSATPATSVWASIWSHSTEAVWSLRRGTSVRAALRGRLENRVRRVLLRQDLFHLFAALVADQHVAKRFGLLRVDAQARVVAGVLTTVHGVLLLHPCASLQ